MKLLTYYHTLKYLKFSQFFYRAYKQFYTTVPKHVNGIQAEITGEWLPYYLHDKKLFDDNRVCFLNVQGTINLASDWNNAAHTKLWLYNLHYFDDLSARGADARVGQHLEFIHRWINQNPAPLGNGWEPYPTSLRIVNWVKAFLTHLPADSEMLDSLAKQTDFLSRDLERHILGNHLFSNAKALIFAGCYLDGKKASSWLSTGLGIYMKELDEQVLGDGANFELTPMYHVIMLLDLLDLLNIFMSYPDKISQNILNETKRIALKMLTWLQVMSHCDGELSFFNDTALGITPKNSIVFEYASKLGLDSFLLSRVGGANLQLFDMANSGYVSVKSFDYSLIADLSQVGPNYIPGHAHADTLSFEFSLFGQRVFVNSGISEYGLNEERLRQRKTAAHNTVSVNGMDSSVVWSGFRVAQRAIVKNRKTGLIDNVASFSACHDGFKQQAVNCIHHRSWVADLSNILITDQLEGDFNSAVGYLHIHPDINIGNIKDGAVELSNSGYILFMKIKGALLSIEESSWHPEFGIIMPNKKLSYQFLSDTVSIEISWIKK